ncbi:MULTISPECIES: hypothetical protein [unclassified Anaeromyxobacter]|nr:MULTISPECIES: hypothetical protein [unclassified Anaeromyxobacter]
MRRLFDDAPEARVRPPTSPYAYDPRGQLEHVTDAARNVTHVK